MSFLQAVKGNVNKAFLGQKHSVSVWIPAIKSAITVTPLIYIPSSTVLFCRAPGPEHLQVAHGDVSVSEGGAAADDLAGLPAGGGGELPEQGTSTALAPLRC